MLLSAATASALVDTAEDAAEEPNILDTDTAVEPPKLRLVLTAKPKLDAVVAAKPLKVLSERKLEMLLLDEDSTPSVLDAAEDAVDEPPAFAEFVLEEDDVKLAELADDDVTPVTEPKLAKRLFTSAGSQETDLTDTDCLELGVVVEDIVLTEVMIGSCDKGLVVSLISSVFSGELLAGEMGS